MATVSKRELCVSLGVFVGAFATATRRFNGEFAGKGAENVDRIRKGEVEDRVAASGRVPAEAVGEAGRGGSSNIEHADRVSARPASGHDESRGGAS